jgi:hypothetical protein
MKKYLVLLIACQAFANNYAWQDIENNLYVGILYSNNNPSVQQFGNPTDNSVAVNLGASTLFNNRIYLNLELNGNFLGGSSYVGNWYDGIFKFGYSLQNDEFNFTPYIDLGIGNQGAYYSTSFNYNYGIGLLSEFMITTDWLLYVDLNYQLQSFTGNINNDFSNSLGSLASYSLTGNSYNAGIGVGVKYITSNGFYFNPFFKWQNYGQEFNPNNNTPNFGTLNPITNQYQVGLNFGLLI